MISASSCVFTCQTSAGRRVYWQNGPQLYRIQTGEKIPSQPVTYRHFGIFQCMYHRLYLNYSRR
uniref:Ig-like domain-containing protein n=1 Tax=Anguilla anguilla TaxID=7936 RepID=A0A0E9PPS7_ANGAN